MSLNVTSASLRDASAVGAILSAATDQAAWLPRLYSRAQELGFAFDMVEAGWVRVARVDAEVFGFVARRANELLALYVAPGAQGYGVGTALLSDAKSHCPALGLWSYQANLGAARFYQREGFQEIQRTNGQGNEAKLPDIRFEWKREVA